MNSEWIVGFLLVFTRFSAMTLSAPILGGQSLPPQIRILAGLSISAAIASAVGVQSQPMPETLFALAAAVAQQALVGLTIGYSIQLALQAAAIAGGLIDLQMGLGMSQTMNPVSGVHITVIGQFKYLLGLVLFFGVDGHHQAILAIVHSFRSDVINPTTINQFTEGIGGMITGVFLIAIQIAAPVIGISLVVDAALGLLNRAVPQLQAMSLGVPAKVLGGLILIGLTLPTLVVGVNQGIDLAFRAIDQAVMRSTNVR